MTLRQKAQTPRYLLQLAMLVVIWGALPLLPASQAQAVDSSTVDEKTGSMASVASPAEETTTSLREILCAVSVPQNQSGAPDLCTETDFMQVEDGDRAADGTTGGVADRTSSAPVSSPAAPSTSNSQSSPQSSAEESSAKDVRGTFYRVQWGDTLYKLSQKFEVPISKIKEWNGLKTDVLLEGEKLRLFLPSSEAQLSPEKSSSLSGAPARVDTGTSSNSEATAAAGSDRSSAEAAGSDQRQPQPPMPGSSSSQEPVEPAEESSPDPSPHDGAIPLDVKESSPLHEKIEKAAATFARSGHARVVVSDDGEEHYPYGRDIPTIYTAVLHVTTVELAKGEAVTSMTIGDNQRWQVNTASAGKKGDFQQFVQIKPQECGTEGKTDMQTNLILMTNRGRTYDLMLKSLPCENQGQGRPKPDMSQWDRSVSFYYPTGRSIGPASNMTQNVDRPDLQGRRSARPRRGRSARARSPMQQVSDSGATSPMPRSRRRSTPRPMAPRARSQPAATNPSQTGRSSRFRSDRGAEGAAIDLRDIQTSHYEVQKDRDFPCEIDLVGDDGERVYIRLADTPGCTSTYPLYEVKDRENLQLTNYQVPNGRIYIKPGPVEKLALLYRQSDGDDSRVTITNTKIAESRRP